MPLLKNITLITILSVFYFNCYAQTPAYTGNVEKEPEIKLDKKVLQNAPKIPLRFGQQELITDRPFLMDPGYGKTSCLLFELPKLKTDQLSLEFETIILNSRLFYPIFITLSADYETRDIIKDKLQIEGNPLAGISHTSHIEVDNTIRYILVTTDSSLVSQSISHMYEISGMRAVYSGSTPIFVPSSTQTVFQHIEFTDEPMLQVKVASASNREIFTREDGFYFGLGVNFGGEQVANNPSGDNYRAGGGGLITFGYSRSLFSSDFVGRAGLGYRLQGSYDGDARNRGIFSDLVLTWQTRHINVGAGGQLETANSIRDLQGNVTTFKTTIVPKFIMEYRIVDGSVNMGAEFLPGSFTTTQNQTFTGNRFALALKFFM
ncbi:MAG: hypothetical protein EA393_01235 [Bacteroidetes bacterium]|nr:MAG: hypothetical protein EA393_01235 [Bacteroidota bacterium]